MAFIEVDGLTKRFGAVAAVNEVGMHIHEQEFITLLGPSGCGKTTTLRLIAGFLVPDHGTISVGGRALSRPGQVVPPESRRMGMVFQNYAVWPHLSLFDNVAFGPKLSKLPRREINERVERVLATVGLEGLENRYPGELSGGQQQRVALARSLVVEPSILLLDEPLSNLDAKLRERMRSELKDLQRRTAITFIYVTHDQAEALALSDRIAVFNQGRVQQFGTPQDIYDHPANLFVADFMGLVNMLSGQVVGRSPEGVLVNVGAQILTASSAASLGERTKVTVVMRPEAIQLGADVGSGDANRFEGKVVDVTFLGNIVEHFVDVGGAVLRVQSHPRRTYAVGSEVSVSIPIEYCAAMAEEP